MRITVFDTETNGIIPKEYKSQGSLENFPYMLQLGSITYDSETKMISNIINTIIKIPDSVVIPENVSNINSITKERTINEGVDIENVLDIFNNNVKTSDIIVAHNIDFDINILKMECLRNNKVNELEVLSSNKKIFCTMTNGTKICKIKKENSFGKYYKWPTLEELHYYLFGKKLQNMHDAYNDLLICLRCYMYMNYKIDIMSENEEIKKDILKLII